MLPIALSSNLMQSETGIKAFGIALKLSLGGNNQFTHPSTYAFAIVTVVCILTQMNYFNKALNEFSQSMFAPMSLMVKREQALI